MAGSQGSRAPGRAAAVATVRRMAPATLTPDSTDPHAKAHAPDARHVITLNRSEHAYLAVDGLTGTVAQTYLLRLDTTGGPALAPDAVRAAFRRLLSAFPRMRAAAEPSLLSWRLRVLPDDARLDHLLDQAHRTHTGVDPTDDAALEAWQAFELNEPLPLERGLAFRSRFVPHPTQPALLFSVHHVVGDGRSMMMMVGALLSAFNGGDMVPAPIDPPTMLPAILPKGLAAWPRAIRASLAHRRAEAQDRADTRIVQLPSRRHERFSIIGVRHHRLALSTAELRRIGKQIGASTNTLLMAGMGTAFFELARELGTDDPRHAAVMRISVDLRRYFPEGRAPGFGNYVASFFVFDRAAQGLDARLRALDAQVKEGLARFERREMIFPWLAAELGPLLGRKLYGALAGRIKRRDSLLPMSCHTTNLGIVDDVNAPDAHVRLVGFHPIVPNYVPLFCMVSLGGRYTVTTSYPASEIDAATIGRLLHHFDAALARFAAEVSVTAAESRSNG